VNVDPMVEEVRLFRDEIAKEHGYDIDAIFEAFRKMEAGSGREHVSLPPRRTTQPGVATDAASPRR